MSYFRLYPTRNTTIFKKITGPSLLTSGNVNTGANPISELMDGNGQSTLLWAFDISSLLLRLQAFPFTCNLKLYDAGTLFEPATSLKPVDLLYFTEEFTEGDGFSYLDGKAVSGFANFNNRTALDSWNNILSQGDLFAFTLNKANEDLTIPVTSFINTAVTNNDNPSFGLRIAVEILAQGTVTIVSASGGDQITNIQVNGINIMSAPVAFITDIATTAAAVVANINAYTSTPNYTASIDPNNTNIIIINPLTGTGSSVNGFIVSPVVVGLTATSTDMSGGTDSAWEQNENVFTKFIYSRSTRTIFKPYLEFTFDDSIVDGRYKAIANSNVRLFLLNDTGVNFTGTTVTASIKDSSDNVLGTPAVVNPLPGIYYVDFTPPMSVANQVIFDTWQIDSVDVARNVVQVQSPNQILTSKDKISNLFFYPVTNYIHPLVRFNDIVQFEVISEQRGKGIVMSTGYEYRVVTSSNFEMVPWTSVNVYNGRHYFSLDTSFFFPELEYEVFVRMKDREFTKTSHLTYKFRLMTDEASHLASHNANPYNSRDFFFKK